MLSPSQLRATARTRAALVSVAGTVSMEMAEARIQAVCKSCLPLQHLMSRPYSEGFCLAAGGDDVCDTAGPAVLYSAMLHVGVLLR